jgi:hypothetical protein
MTKKSFESIQDWIDNEGWKNETHEQLLDRLASFCLTLRKTTSYKHFSRITMLKSSDYRVRDQVYINDKAKLMQKILEHMGAKKYRMSSM